jgi:hypothetical protein
MKGVCMDIDKVLEEQRKKASERKSLEREIDTKQRMKDVVLRRDEAVRKIEQYQDETGIPEDDEIDDNFLSKESDGSLDLNVFREKENEEN